MSDKKIYITDKDYRTLFDIVKTAREYNKEDKKYLNNLQNELDKAIVVEGLRLPQGIVSMYSKVEIYDISEGETMLYTIVFPDDSDIDKNKISVLSPLGTALIGEKEGSEVELNIMRGKRRIIIKKVIANYN